MKQKQYKYFLIVSYILMALVACKKREPVDWDTNFIGPLFKTTLSVKNLIPDTLKEINADQTVSLVYNANFNTFNFNELAVIPDTGIYKVFTIPFGSIQLNPGDPFISNQTQETKIAISNLELSHITVKSGVVEVKVTNKISQPINVIYTLPKALKNGVPYVYSSTIPPASGLSDGISISTFDLSGYEIDLRGILGATVNTIITNLNASISNTANTATTVYSTDSVIISLKLKNLVPSYARGYFGQYTDTTISNNAFTLFDAIKAGTFSIDDAILNFDIKNGIGADMKWNILNLTSINNKTGSTINLQNSLINQNINMQRATDNPFIPRLYSYHFDKTNSNIVSFLENRPTAINFGIAIALNPFGNIGNGTDFVYTDKAIDANINLEIPLHFSTENLTFWDTLSLDSTSLPEHNTVRSGNLKLIALNKFPFDAELKLYLLDENNQLKEQLFTESLIKMAIPDNDGRVRTMMESRLNIPVSAGLLNELLQKRKLFAKVVFNTYNNPDKIKIYEDYKLDLKLVGDLIFNVQIK